MRGWRRVGRWAYELDNQVLGGPMQRPTERRRAGGYVAGVVYLFIATELVSELVSTTGRVLLLVGYVVVSVPLVIWLELRIGQRRSG